MKYKYGDLPREQISKQKKYLTNAVFKLLPFKENEYEFLDSYFVSLLFMINGMNELFGHQPEIVTLLSILESARTENDFALYRKAILDSLDLITKIREDDEGA